MGAPQRAFPSAELPYGLWVACLARTGKPELLTRPAPQCNLSDTDHLYDKKQHGCQVQSFQLHCSQRTARQLQCNNPLPQTSTNFNTQTPSFPYELAKSTRALPPAHTHRRANAPQLSARHSSYKIKTGLARSSWPSECQWNRGWKVRKGTDVCIYFIIGHLGNSWKFLLALLFWIMTLELYLSELHIYLKNNPKCYKPLPMFLFLLTRLKKGRIMKNSC